VRRCQETAKWKAPSEKGFVKMYFLGEGQPVEGRKKTHPATPKNPHPPPPAPPKTPPPTQFKGGKDIVWGGLQFKAASAPREPEQADLQKT